MVPAPLKIILATTESHAETAAFLCRNLNIALVLIDTGLTPPASQGWKRLCSWRDPLASVRRAERRFQDFACNRLKIPLGLADRLLTARFPHWDDIANCLGVKIVRVADINGKDAQSVMCDVAPDLGLIFGGRILKSGTLAIPKIGFLNKHSALLPRNRGVMAEFWCLYKEEIDALGVTIHFARPRLDGGEIVIQRPMPFCVGDTAETLRQRSHLFGREAMLDAVRLIQWGRSSGRVQDEALASRNSYPSKQQVEELAERLPVLWQRYGMRLKLASA